MTPVLFIPTLKRQERTRLENHLRRTRDVRYADRLRAVLWSSERCPVPEIGHRLGKHPSTVQRWLHAYRRSRIRGLELGKSPGRPRCIATDGEECLRQAVLTQPRDLNYRFTRWSSATLTAHLFHLPGRKNAAGFVTQLKGLCPIYPDQHLLLFLDNCSIHHAQVVQRFLADHRDRITLLWSAPYTPELNLIGRYWGHLKAKATDTYFFGTVEELESAIRHAVRDFNRSPAPRMTCNLESMRPLRKAA
jgi:transposase